MNSKIDTQTLKAKHRIEMIMQEAGERFKVDPNDLNHWISQTTLGLTVDIQRQTFELKKPGMDLVGGDVIAWLQRHFAWKFGMAIKFLKGRVPDPERSEKKPEAEIPSRKICVNSSDDPLDKWQEKALKLAGNEIRAFFSESWLQICHIQSLLPSRFLPIIDVSIDTCSECGDLFKWGDLETRAYLCDGMDFGGKDLPKEERNKFFLDVWVEGLICEKCMREKANFYRALSYCISSARKRDKDAAAEEPILANIFAVAEEPILADMETDPIAIEAAKSVIARRGGDA